MGKGSTYRKGHNPKKQRANYDEIDWSVDSSQEASHASKKAVDSKRLAKYNSSQKGK